MMDDEWNIDMSKDEKSNPDQLLYLSAIKSPITIASNFDATNTTTLEFEVEPNLIGLTVRVFVDENEELKTEIVSRRYKGDTETEE